MQDENIVHDLFVVDGNRSVKATYFVERGILHANVDGRSMIMPIGADGSEDTVRRLVIGQMHIMTWRQRLLEHWGRR